MALALALALPVAGLAASEPPECSESTTQTCTFTTPSLTPTPPAPPATTTTTTTTQTTPTTPATHTTPTKPTRPKHRRRSHRPKAHPRSGRALPFTGVDVALVLLTGGVLLASGALIRLAAQRIT